MIEGSGDGWPTFDGFVNDWTEWTLDSSEDWDALYGSGRRTTGDTGGGVYAARAGNKLTVRHWDQSPPVAGTQDYEMWFPYAGDYPDDGDRQRFGENISRPYYPRSASLFVDSSDNVWQVNRVNYSTVAVTKKNAANAFLLVETRDLQQWYDTEEPPNLLPKQMTDCVAVYQVDDKLHMAFLDANGRYYYQTQEWRAYYSCFDMSTETWDVENEAIHTDQVSTYYDGWIDLVVRSTGEVVVFRPGPVTVHGTLSESIATYSRRTGVDTWTSASWTNTYTNYRTAQYPGDTSRVFLGKDDRCHFFDTGYTGSLVGHHISISNTNVFDTIQSLSPLPFSTQAFQGDNSVTRTVGSDLYCYYFYVYDAGGISGTPDKHAYYVWKSEANPTLTSVTFNSTEGLDHNYGDTYGPEGPMLGFKSSDGYVNFFRNEADTAYSNPGDRGHTVTDGFGTYIYTQKTLSDNFDIVRDMLGATQQPRGEVTTGVNWSHPTTAWGWAYPMTALTYSGTYGYNDSLIFGGGMITIDGSDFVYLADGYSQASYAPDVLIVWPLKDTPSMRSTHTTDMVLNPLPIASTSDLITKSAGGTQYSDHTTDVVCVGRESHDHTTDMSLSSQVKVTHTTDIQLVKYIDLTVDIYVTFGVGVGYELLKAADIEVIKEGQKLRYGTGKIVRKD